MAAPQYEGSGTEWEGSPGSTSLVLDAPAGVAADGIVVATIYVDGTTLIASPETGFALPGSSPSAAANHKTYVYWKRSAGSEPASYTFTLAADQFVHAQVHWFSGCKTTGSPFDTSTDADFNDSNSTTPPAVNITTSVDDALLLYLGTCWAGGSWTAPDVTWTERMDFGFGLMTLDTKVQATAGASGSVQATCTNADKTTAWLGALLPVAADTDATVNASTIAVTAAFPSAAKSTGSTVSPSAIAASTALPAAAKSTGSTVSPNAIAASTAFPAATESGGATVAPAVLAATTTLPAAAVRTGSTVSPAAVAAVAALPGAAVQASGSATVTPSTIAAVATLPAATVGSATNATITPATIAAVATLPAVIVTGPPGVVYTRFDGVLVRLGITGVVRIGGAAVAFG